MARTLLYAPQVFSSGPSRCDKEVKDTGIVGLPSVLVRAGWTRVARALEGSCDGWLLLVVVEVKPRLWIYIENPTSAPNQSIQEEFRRARTVLYDPGMVGLPSVLVPSSCARVRPVGAPGAPRPRTLGGVAPMVGCCWWMMM